MKVLVIGDSMLDEYWYGDVTRLSPEAPVPVVNLGRKEYRLGAAANVAHNCKTLGAEVRLVTSLGQDEAAIRILEMCREVGIEVFPKECSRTTVKVRVIGKNQQVVRVDSEEKCEPLPCKHDDWPDVVVLSDYGKGSIQGIFETSKPVLVDTKSDDYKRFKGCAVLKQNVPEFRASVGRWDTEEELEAIAKRVRSEINGNVLLTRAEKGMTLFSDKRINFESAAKEVFDVTGAGDTVMAALAVFYGDLERACGIANKAAGIVVGKFGTATVSLDELGQI